MKKEECELMSPECLACSMKRVLEYINQNRPDDKKVTRILMTDGDGDYGLYIHEDCGSLLIQSAKSLTNGGNCAVCNKPLPIPEKVVSIDDIEDPALSFIECSQTIN